MANGSKQPATTQLISAKSEAQAKDSGINFPHRPSHKSSGFIALGDSYSAGIGTGFNGTENDCRQGLNAYPKLIHADLNRWGRGDLHSEIQFLSCTGSTIDNILSGSEHSQIDNLNVTPKADFALLSIGGNDLGFFEIMNSCIFRFYSFYSGTCEDALRKSERALNGRWFEHRLRLAIMEILDRVQWEKRPWFTVTVTGYARFFNEHTHDCDNRSFGVWWRGPKLKQSLRHRMNNMVLAVNNKIRRSVAAINAGFTIPRVFFVDYDDAFEGHRFCEPNVTEPDYSTNNTWFFLVGGQDNDDGRHGQSAAYKNNKLLPFGSPLVDPDACLGPAEKSGDWGELAVCLMAKAKRQDPVLQSSLNTVVTQSSMWYVPTYYGKTFHPRTLGHKAIRDRIYEFWGEQP
ncbi:SAGA complex subunit Sgf73 [Conoideocrella luteorostrata]|uniref:SAGA complex subunit Sgf73 n=1 Tax=Conoideocrella luteorostrata TaxID=1105319 RepID=A0AAJ0D0E9_9HYPO|nr:SAGA complex subunit Sgf73 [Conoideocrella luteorostrata]